MVARLERSIRAALSCIPHFYGDAFHNGLLDTWLRNVTEICLELSISMKWIAWLVCFSLVFMCLTVCTIYFQHLERGSNSLQLEIAKFEQLQQTLHGEKEPNEVVDDEAKCEVVHIAMVVSDTETVQRLVVVVKSILFYRHNPIHFHFLLNTRSKEIVSTIFKTWLLPAVRVSFYSLSNATNAVKWSPDSCGLDVHAVARLTLVNVLPSSLKAVIVLDIDVMLSSDIGQLWAFGRQLMKDKKKFALVENQRDSLLDTLSKEDNKSWPTAGRSYHSGVMVLNLELLRATNWNETWQSIAKNTLKTQSKTVFSDQEVINAVVKNDSGTVLILPCVWNVQLSESTQSDCSESTQDFKIVYWSLSARTCLNNPYTQLFDSMLRMFEDFDSTLFRAYISGCEAPASQLLSSKEKGEGKEGPCSELKREAKLKRRVHPYYLNYSYQSSDNNDVTLVTHTSMERLYMLETLYKYWEGPVSLVLYASDAELREAKEHISSSPVLRDTKRLALHVVSKSGKFYPYNYLRNIAIDYVNTPYIYMTDIDFLPRQGLYKYAKEAVKLIGDSNKRALIVPAFETFYYGADFPNSKSQLLMMLRDRILFPFKSIEWKLGHNQTDYERWKRAKRPYTVKWVERFEPYLIMSKTVPRYDERFVGYGGDKESHVMELAIRGYELTVLPKAFMVHMPHAPTWDKIGFRRRTEFFDCIKAFKEDFKREIDIAVYLMNR